VKHAGVHAEEHVAYAHDAKRRCERDVTTGQQTLPGDLTLDELRGALSKALERF
jgi:hypothetical protein